MAQLVQILMARLSSQMAQLECRLTLQKYPMAQRVQILKDRLHLLILMDRLHSLMAHLKCRLTLQKYPMAQLVQILLDRLYLLMVHLESRRRFKDTRWLNWSRFSWIDYIPGGSSGKPTDASKTPDGSTGPDSHGSTTSPGGSSGKPTDASKTPDGSTGPDSHGSTSFPNGSPAKPNDASKTPYGSTVQILLDRLYP
ncbi:hypothetical protein L596_024489 [Steinernema carpocapsae]|uniref:Uncharacterized protein n=1 Tax=Steinernema carpocapsae TaxID=34508 RepID=A0A4U5MGW5_STECR|nr:hypothetical protein L596_024489 [Steinernema carpocapsae]